MAPGQQQYPEHNSEGRCVSVHWYRHGLRLHDNPALLEALKGADTFYPIFIFDGNVAGTGCAD